MPKKTTKKSVTKSSEPTLGYTLEVKVNDTVFTTEAASLEEALTQFVQNPAYPIGAKTKLFIVCTNNGVTRKRFFQTPAARRMIANLLRKPAAITVLADQLTRSFNE
jgi:hypothetical protein